mgnify:CR=1 FL=1
MNNKIQEYIFYPYNAEKNFEVGYWYDTQGHVASSVSFYLRTSHLEKLRAIIEDPEATDNDRFVAYNLLQNAVVAVEGQLPSCQDTGTAIVMAKKGENVYTGADDAEWLSKGIFNTYQNKNLRYSQIVPISMFEEKNSGSNLPAQIDIYAKKGASYEFLFLAKGGGSANKTFLYQKTKSLLNEKSLEEFVKDKIKDLSAVIREELITNSVSGISAVPEVRAELLTLQRDLIEKSIAEFGGVVVEGRDIGTTVWPDAELKIFLTADVAARAVRRQAQLSELAEVSANSVADSLAKRDAIDSMRAASPLRQSEDQIVLDATYLNLEETIQALWNLIEERKLNG